MKNEFCVKNFDSYCFCSNFVDMRYEKLIILLSVSLCLCLSACHGSGLHFDVDRSEYPVKGIDLSAHNGIVDFERVKADSVEFVMLKATEGAEFCDAMFARNHSGVVEAGMKVGAYHFFRFDVPGHLQAYHFLSVVQNKALDLPLAIDVEEWQNAGGVPDDEVIAQLRMMVDVLVSSGHRVMIYTNKKGLAAYVQPEFEGELPLWISSPSSNPGHRDWSLWQHSHEGAVQGINGPVDIDTFNGTLSQFNAWCDTI